MPLTVTEKLDSRKWTPGESASGLRSRSGHFGGVGSVEMACTLVGNARGPLRLTVYSLPALAQVADARKR